MENLKEILELHALWVKNDSDGARADLSEANLYGENLYGANLYEADLGGANLEGVNLEGANLEGANLYGANLEGANLEGVNLFRVNLIWANLKGANLKGLDLKEVNLVGANLAHTTVFTFCLGKHFAFFHEGYLKIGCEGHSLKHWLENGEDIADKAEYTKEEKARYLDMINLLKKWSE